MLDQINSKKDCTVVFIVNDSLAGKIVSYHEKTIPIIDESDAKFLCYEKRIDSIVSKNRDAAVNFQNWFVV